MTIVGKGRPTSYWIKKISQMSDEDRQKLRKDLEAEIYQQMLGHLITILQENPANWREALDPRLIAKAEALESVLSKEMKFSVNPILDAESGVIQFLDDLKTFEIEV